MAALRVLLRNARLPAVSAAVVPWTLEEAARFAALRDVEVFRLLLADRRLLAAAKRQHFLPPSAVAPGGSGATADDEARSSARGPANLRRGGTACPAGAQAAQPSHAAACRSVAEQPVQHNAARPRRRSEAKLAERKAKFEDKWRRRRFFDALPLVGAFIRRSASGSGGEPTPPDAAVTGGTPMPAAEAGTFVVGAGSGRAPRAGPGASKRRRKRHGGEPSSARCEGSDGSARPTPTATAAAAVRPPSPYVRQWTDEDGRAVSQVYGRCGGCAEAHALDFREDGGRGWLCAQCWAASGLFG